MRILIVDDSKVSRKVQAIALRELGFSDNEIFEADNAKEAFVFLDEKEISMILLDWNMPEVSGVEFIKLFQSKFPTSKIPIVMVTSDGRKDSIVEVARLGIAAYIIKPIDRKVFKAKIFQLKEKIEKEAAS
jgi:two-component system, chemotaxis family, chemotaxis protein CheY